VARIQQAINSEPRAKKPTTDPSVKSSEIWSELRIFLSVSRLGSFAKAGENLGISTPTISRSVRRLQDVLGVQLVIPGISGAVLTPEGQSLQASLGAIDLNIHALETGFKKAAGQLAGVVRLGAMEGIGGAFVAPELNQFQARFPGITVSLMSITNLDRLLNNICDIAISFDPPKRADITSKLLGYLHLIPVASQKYIEQHGLPTKDNLRNHQYISYVSSQRLGDTMDVFGEWNLLMADSRHAGEFENSITYSMAAASGLGIALLGSYSLADHSLVQLNLGGPMRLPLYLSVLIERLEARHIRVTAEWLTRLFTANQQWFGEEPINLREPDGSIDRDVAAFQADETFTGP
jgi:DNA-binding transcriptional LysR family regulator